MIGHMPTKQVIALLTSAKPAQAAGILLSMTPDRVAVLLTELDPAHTARILLAARDRRADVFMAIPAEQVPQVLAHLSMPQFVELLVAVPPPAAAQLLRDRPPRWAADILSELPPETSTRLRAILTEDQSEAFSSAVYERRAAESVVGIATRVSWSDQRACDLLAEVFGKQVHIAVRYLPRAPLTASDVDLAASYAHWGHIVGLVLLTNVALDDSGSQQARAFTRSGRPLEALRWIDERDDGAFKRALVRLAG